MKFSYGLEYKGLKWVSPATLSRCYTDKFAVFGQNFYYSMLISDDIVGVLVLVFAQCSSAALMDRQVSKFKYISTLLK